ncbi:hypothetical protein Glove_372g76 [Diversispora epigaea]|uniref:Uncharacterized protein n=1 Tax=Diversispora epigaea TaxID=1348612 RepID=A0A397H7K0_9GLOM|nr:hypothetical protein Glove_372g76 [Diversispora epigaea]
MIGDSFNLIKLQERNISIPQNANSVFNIIATVDERYNETQSSAPKLIYQSKLPNITVFGIDCGVSSSGIGQNGSDQNVYGYYFNEIKNEYEKWEFSEPSVLNPKGILIILPNNTLPSPSISDTNFSPSNLTHNGYITITYYDPVELSDGYLWIYRINNIATQNVTRQFIFVPSKVSGEPLNGINIWNFTSIPKIEETYPGTVSGVMRLNIEGTKYYENLNSTGKDNFISDLRTELSKIIPINIEQLSPSVKNLNQKIYISLKIQSSRSKRSVKSIIDDLNDMIKYKRITAISLFPNTNYLDEDFGSVPKQNLWEKYKVVTLLLQLGLIIFDFIINALFVSNNGKVVEELYIPSLMFLTVPTVVNAIWAFYIIFDKNRSKTFLDWFTQHGALIFTVLSGADIEALSILHSNMSGFEFFNAPFSTKGKNSIFWASRLNIFVKDIPQVIIQILYIHSVVIYDIISLFALISSCLNLLVNIVGRLFQTINICRYGSLEVPAN